MCIKNKLTLEEQKICPICKNNILGYPAISRKDNKTEICSNCGTLEALKEFILYEKIEEIINSNTPKLIALCGKACTGKTTTVVKLSEYLSYSKNVPIVFFSLELSKECIINKIEHNNSNLFIVDTPGITTDEIRQHLRNLKREKDIKFVVIDYLQLVNYDKSKCLSRNIEIENICKELKELVVELNVSILFTSYLSSRGKNLIEDKEKLKEIDEKIFLDDRTLYC